MPLYPALHSLEKGVWILKQLLLMDSKVYRGFWLFHGKQSSEIIEAPPSDIALLSRDRDHSVLQEYAAP